DTGIRLIERESGCRKVLVAGNIAVSKHHALGFARGTRGIDKRCQILRLRGTNKRVKHRITLSPTIIDICNDPGKPNGSLGYVSVHDHDALKLSLRSNGVELVKLLPR